MDKLSVQRRKSNKQGKAKKMPIKVVYISNPMKVTTSESEFRAVVQELTGRDSDVADLSKFPGVEDASDTGAVPPESSSAPETSSGAAGGADGGADRRNDGERNAASPLDMFDDAFARQVLENFPSFLPYEPAGVDGRST